MNGDVKAHQLPELRVSEAQLVRIVGSVVERWVTIGHCGVVSVLVVEDDGSDAAHLSAEVQAVLKGRLPILGLVHTALVCLHEVAIGLASQDTHGELSHSVHVTGERSDHALLVSAKLTSAEEFFLERGNFRFSWHFAREEKPQNALRNGLTAWNSSRRILTDIKKFGTTVRDTLCRVELRSLIQHTWDAAHATDNLCDSDITNDSVGVLFAEGNNFLLAFSDNCFHALAKYGRREVASGSCSGSFSE